MGGSSVLLDELAFAGFVDNNAQLTVNEKPFNVFARLASGVMHQPSMQKEQEALGDYSSRFKICRNRQENDDFWDSRDPSWLGRASMARRHRFLTTRDLHWQWFNPIAFGMVPEDEEGVGPAAAFAEAEAMKAAALQYAQKIGGWSDEVGLFVNIFGHNSVNSLFIHIIDMSEPSPSLQANAFKNCSLDMVLKVLAEEANSGAPPPRSLQPGVYHLSEVETLRLRRRSFFFKGTDGATSLKAELVGRLPVLIDAAAFREARRLMLQELGGVAALKRELVRSGFVEAETNLLTTGVKPFNVFARVAAGVMKQPGMEKENEALGDFQSRFIVARNLPENDAHWDSKDPEWVGKSSMALRHRFITTKSLHLQWFNALVFGLVPEKYGGIGLEAALAEIEAMRIAALQYTAASNWSDNIGLYVHVFGHNSVNSLHVHIVDLADVGPSYWKCEHKNLSLDMVIKVLREELAAEMEINQAVESGLEGSELVLPDVMELNVGGSLVVVSRATLLQVPIGSVLHSMFVGGWNAPEHQKDAHDRIFLDFPPDPFIRIVNYLRLFRLAPPGAIVPAPQVEEKESEQDYRTLVHFLGIEAFMGLEPGSSS